MMLYCLSLLIILISVNAVDYLRFTNDQPFVTDALDPINLNSTYFMPNAVNYDCTSTDQGTYTSVCDYNGICITDGTCKCDDGYITWPDNNSVGCNYKQKSQLIAFLLSFFLGGISGAGEWYLNNTTTALVQLLLFWTIPMTCLCGAVTCGVTTNSGEGGIGCSGCMAGLQTFAVLGLWLYIWIVVIMGSYHDGNGAPLTPI
jgi:hypothetical protein